MSCGISGSLYDLTGNKIQETYQRLLQIAGPDNVLYDGTGSLVEKLTVSGSITASFFVGDGSQLTNLPSSKKSWTWEAGRQSNNVSNQYLRRADGVFTNISPFNSPYSCSLISMTARTNGSETWIAEIRKNGTVIGSIPISASNKGFTLGLSSSIAPMDDISFYCNGSQINNPTIIGFFEEI